MNPWRKPVASLAFVVICAVVIAILPLSSLAAPQGVTGTPLYLPLVARNGVGTATPTGTPITPTIPITVGASGLAVYAPFTITVHVNDTVRWTWAASLHTVTSGTYPTADNQFCSPNNSNCSVANTSNAGATFDHQFTSIGTYLYFCQIHGAFGMTGTIVVKP